MTLPTDDPIYKTDLAMVLLEILDENPELKAYFFPSRPQAFEKAWSTFDCIDRDKQ